jgi:signal transduction histidine kinase
MSTGLLGPYDDAFVANRSWLGYRHVDIALAQHYMAAAMNILRRAYRERIVIAYPAAEANAVCTAVDKLLDVEGAVMLHHHQIEAQTKLVAGERQQRLEQVEAIQTLCAGLAHELRNPLNSAKLQLELAERRLRRGSNDPKLVEPIELAQREIDRLTGLLDEFLAFARPHALDVRSLDVVSVVRDVVENDRALADKRGADLTLVTSTARLVAEIDETKIRQIVDSLVSNALEAVTIGGHVSVAVVPADRHIHIRVSDDGPGIPADILPRIYEPFFSTKEGGTGMGMSIVHSLVTLHRGTIEVTSSLEGTTFDVSIPRGCAESNLAAPEHFKPA